MHRTLALSGPSREGTVGGHLSRTRSQCNNWRDDARGDRAQSLALVLREGFVMNSIPDASPNVLLELVCRTRENEVCCFVSEWPTTVPVAVRYPCADKRRTCVPDDQCDLSGNCRPTDYS